MKSPLKAALRRDSHLQNKVCAGLGALKRAHKDLIHIEIRGSFSDSVDIDENLRKGNEASNRWDYLIGHSESSSIVGFEPHSAHTKEASVVIAKKQSARQLLKAHLNSSVSIKAWFWVASGKVDFVPHEKVILQLQQAGISFVGGMLRAKHIPRMT